MTAKAATTQHDIHIERAEQDAPILRAAGRESIAIRAGTIVRIGGRTHAFEIETALTVAEMSPGNDYGIRIDDAGGVGVELVTAGAAIDAGIVAGFHFAPSACAEGASGGDGVPAINPFSCWDAGFRPACPDPRGMALVEMAGGRRFWSDIYLLGAEHAHGTSRCAVEIADGRNRPMRAGGSGRYNDLNYATAVEIYAHNGKQLLGAEEFFAAAYGVAERCSRDSEPTVTGSLDDDARRFVSRFGLFDATGTMWQWGTDGHPDDPRPSLFGGAWLSGSDAGSRYAGLGSWPEYSHGRISARGRCDHMQPDGPRGSAGLI